MPVTVDDGSGGAFEKVKSKEEEQQEARAAVDTAPLITQIDGHTGRANLMAVPFSQLVNAMEAQGTLAVGVIQEKYYDGAAERAKGAEGSGRLPFPSGRSATGRSTRTAISRATLLAEKMRSTSSARPRGTPAESR